MGAEIVPLRVPYYGQLNSTFRGTGLVLTESNFDALENVNNFISIHATNFFFDQCISQ